MLFISYDNIINYRNKIAYEEKTRKIYETIFRIVFEGQVELDVESL